MKFKVLFQFGPLVYFFIPNHPPTIQAQTSLDSEPNSPTPEVGEPTLGNLPYTISYGLRWWPDIVSSSHHCFSLQLLDSESAPILTAGSSEPSSYGTITTCKEMVINWIYFPLWRDSHRGDMCSPTCAIQQADMNVKKQLNAGSWKHGASSEFSKMT